MHASTSGLGFLACSATFAAAQCSPQWSALGSGASDQVLAVAVFDEDAGGPGLPKLFIAGSFLSAGNAGGTSYIARWDGSTWSGVGGGLSGIARAFAVFDSDGAGSQPPALYVGGQFLAAGSVANTSRIARWTGTAWQSVGGGASGTVHALAAVDADGPGSQPTGLFVGGEFLSVGSASATRIARWSGSSWSSLASGASGPVYALAGAAPGAQTTSLYAGGAFLSAGNIAGTTRIARWNGGAWSALGAGASGDVRAITEFDPDGSAPAVLIVAGDFLSAGNVPSTVRIAAWSGSAWSALGAGASGPINALVTADLDGPGAQPRSLFAAGQFLSAGSAPGTVRLAQWSGTAWSAVAGGLAGEGWALAPWDPDGGGASTQRLIVGGSFLSVGGNTSANRVASLAVGAPPVITQHPASVAACMGTPVSFVVAAFGQPAVSYQWRRNGANIPGATGSTYSIASVAGGHAGTYTVVVGNTCGSITSNGATLTVNQPVSITQQPEPALAFAGQPVSFSVSASGAAPLTYQWRRNSINLNNGGNISGVTTPTLTINAVGPGDVGSYSVLVTNPCGVLLSQAAALTISCYANCDDSSASPMLNVADFTCFLQQFAAGNAYANCDNSVIPPTLNVADFACFLQQFAAGCP